MAMTKAEMEAHRARYSGALNAARLAESTGHFGKAVESAASSFEFIDGMMQYERKYNDREFTGIDSIDIVLKYAPLLFDFASLDSLAALLKGQKRIDKNASNDLAGDLLSARDRMRQAHSTWDLLERTPGATITELSARTGCMAASIEVIAAFWERYGLLRRAIEHGGVRLFLVHPINEIVSAKCPACAVVATASKGRLLQEPTCPKCNMQISFVFIAKEAPILA